MNGFEEHPQRVRYIEYPTTVHSHMSSGPVRQSGWSDATQHETTQRFALQRVFGKPATDVEYRGTDTDNRLLANVS